MFSFLTNTSTALALSAIGLKILASVKFKTHFLGNIVPALFISLMFVGCGGGDSDEPPRVADISTQADLASINGRSSYLAGHYTLVNDITLDTPSGAGWTPIGTSANPFRGTFNGNGFVIRGLKVNRTSADYVGLFGYAHGATIRNLGVEIDSSGVKGKNYVGGIAGSFVRGSITDSYAIGKVEGRVYAGGLAGLLNKSSVSDSYFSGNINGTSG
ncbi:MAG: hypothetical protein LBQ18_05685, partial [Campylobacteraceae bacterium]|nr:hypothetical protein [Campylobacteraceae bacterium]